MHVQSGNLESGTPATRHFGLSFEQPSVFDSTSLLKTDFRLAGKMAFSSRNRGWNHLLHFVDGLVQGGGAGQACVKHYFIPAIHALTPFLPNTHTHTHTTSRSGTDQVCSTGGAFVGQNVSTSQLLRVIGRHATQHSDTDVCLLKARELERRQK